ncbi:MAG: chromosome segregation protein SMC [Pseudomonadales bacterium]|nr:chromosome segregation protein SMC [Pseudomonadales bacterium]
MRLKTIKLAGFKSFVDPTTVHFPYDLSAVVGPNGCGKSNIIDAVRWVMGESSAKQLRGESMTDVIFNGSTARKPVGQCTIELIFDNTETTLTGEYAQYAEISIKRKLTREGQSVYYLNGTRCRRRDIVDIFLGTGLGPRSYSIIEQGMISNIIEAKPAELRVYLEEAAGISKYKERRKETANRMRHTVENLDRVKDLSEELEKQARHLDRQAKSAEKYKEYREQERQQKAQLMSCRWQEFVEQFSVFGERIQEEEVRLEESNANTARLDLEIEQSRVNRDTNAEKRDQVQEQFYRWGNEISRREQSISHQKERIENLQRDIPELDSSIHRSQQDLDQNRNKLTRLESESQQIAPRIEQLTTISVEHSAALSEQEVAYTDWQHEWDQFQETAAEPARLAEVEKSQIQYSEQRIERLTSQSNKLTQELEQLQLAPEQQAIEELQDQVMGLDMESEQYRELLEQLTDEVKFQQDSNRQNYSDLDRQRGQLQDAKGHLKSLQVLQESALQDVGEGFQHWLERNKLADVDRLFSKIEVQDGWDIALEVVLGDQLQGLCIEDAKQYRDSYSEVDSFSVVLLEKDTRTDAIAPASSAPLLIDQVNSDWDLGELLEGVFAVEDIDQAFALRENLSRGQSIVTRDGIWLGANWLRIVKRNDPKMGMLQRGKEITQLESIILELATGIDQVQQTLDSGLVTLKESEQQREKTRSQNQQIERQSLQLKADIERLKARREQALDRQQRIAAEMLEFREELEEQQQGVSSSRLRLQSRLDEMAENDQARTELRQKKELLQEQLNQTRREERESKEQYLNLLLEKKTLETSLQFTRDTLSRLQQQWESDQQRLETLRAELSEASEPLEELKFELEELLEKRLEVDKQLQEAREKMNEADNTLRNAETQRADNDQRVQALRGSLETLRVGSQEVKVKAATLVEQIEQLGFRPMETYQTIPEGVDQSVLQESLDTLERRIQRLGAINLAAIEEHKAVSERCNYLIEQQDDLHEALATLEEAMRKIDRETRGKFKECFDEVNQKFQVLFPKVFGGGYAQLEMTGEDLLDTGVTITARPPGKRNSTIHLLSGGEKALTAISLIFAIFQLNPSPFCMLDEVDAPLDDANTARYARLLEEMSSTIQFIYITHNKISMEMAHQLLGVTMHEPGVSRLVTVDVDEAVAMATA